MKLSLRWNCRNVAIRSLFKEDRIFPLCGRRVEPRVIAPVVHAASISTFYHNLNVFKVQVDFECSKKIHPNKMALNTAVLRYEPGAERFQFSFTMKSGKAFNFDRPVTETIAKFQERITLNMQKKIKGVEVATKLLLPKDCPLDNAMLPILDEIIQASIPCKFRINSENEMPVLVNPPEVYSIKFSAAPFVGYPLFPNKFEGSSKFIASDSKYTWSYTKDVEMKKLVPKKDAKWIPCNSSSEMVITPDESAEGGILRLTCVPTDGSDWGFPTSFEVKTPVSKITASPLLYEERLTRLDPVDESDPSVLRFVSYNILANTYTTEEWFADSPKESLVYEYRLPLLLRELEAYQGDIICLQEVEEKSFEGDLAPFLELRRGMKGAFTCKVGTVREGVAMFYNTAKLSFLEHDTIVLMEEMKQIFLYDIVASHPDLKARLEDRNTVLQICVFESLCPGKPIIVVANTHLYFHPNADHIRLLQTITCIDHLQRKVKSLKEKYPGRELKTFFCGDFNCTPPFSSYRLLTTGSVAADDFDWSCYKPEALVPGVSYTHQLNLVDSHPEHGDTNFTVSFTDCLDYILYQPNHAKLLKSYPPPNRATLASILKCREDKVALPNFHAPSDHVPLIADFSLQGQ